MEDMFFDLPPYSKGKGVLFAGTMSCLKNPLALVRAMPLVLKKHPDAVLRVCGRPADAEYISAIEQQVRASDLDDRVQIMGVVTRREIMEMLAESVCLALPSRQENTPIVIAQAMAAARAIVATPVGAIPEMVQEGETGFLVDPDDSPALAARIVSLMDDAELARQMGENGRNKALATYERHAHIDSLMEICRSMLYRNQTTGACSTNSGRQQ